MTGVRIESPFPAIYVPRIWAWLDGIRDKVADDFGPKTLEEFVEDWNSRPQKTWAVYRGEETLPGGFVTFQQWSPYIGTAHCLFRKTHWGHDTTVPALQLVAAEIFDSGVKKISMSPFRSNWQIKAVLKKLGAKLEGTLREHTVQNGQPVDVLMYGLTKKDFEEVQDATIGDHGRDGRSGGALGRTNESVEKGNDHFNPHPQPGTSGALVGCNLAPA